MPLLILQGGRDYQVLEEKDFKEWNDAFKNDSKATLKLFPSLNHLFITGEGKSTPQDYNVEGHVSMEVINTIIEWIKENMENQNEINNTINKLRNFIINKILFWRDN